MILSKKQITKALIRLRGCTGWPVPMLFANPQRQVFSRQGPFYLQNRLKVELKKSYMPLRFCEISYNFFRQVGHEGPDHWHKSRFMVAVLFSRAERFVQLCWKVLWRTYLWNNFELGPMIKEIFLVLVAIFQWSRTVCATLVDSIMRKNSVNSDQWFRKCHSKQSDLFVCFVALHPKSTAMVMVGPSVHLTTLFPGQAWTSG